MGLTFTGFEHFALCFVTTALLMNSCEGAGSFYNPILDTPNSEQYIYRHSDDYYYMTAHFGYDLYLFKSESLSDWRLAERKIIHTKNGTGAYHYQPEIKFISGNWYVYYHSLKLVVSENQMIVIGALNPDNPFGQYSNEMRISPVTPEEVHDGVHETILQSTNGRLYLIYSGRATNNTGTRKIFIAPMSNPTTISGPRILIRDTMSTWDTEIQSPQILRQNENGNETTFLVFTGISEGVECLGLMGIEEGKDPLVAANWWHYPNGTVFTSNTAAHVYSPGHVSFTYSPDFSETWMAYRAKTSSNGSDFTTRLDKIEWNEDGTPGFPTPTALGTPIPLPSGDIS